MLHHLPSSCARALLTLHLLAAAALLAPLSLGAQEQVGTLRGQVLANGAPLAAVDMALIGPVGRLVTTTDEAGAFAFPRLPPGAFSLRASHPVLGSADASGDLGLGQTLVVTLELAPSTGNGGSPDRPVGAAGAGRPAAGEPDSGSDAEEPTSPVINDQLTVRGEAVIRSDAQSGTSVVLSSDELAALPHGRDLLDLVALAPNAIRSRAAGGISIGGASGSENRFLIDGVDTTHPQTGLSAKPLSAELIAEVQVKSAGYRAEFGGATGGVISALTRSGSNTWQLRLGAVTTDSELDGSPRPQIGASSDGQSAVYRHYRRDDQTTVEPLVTLGGPLWRDHAWLFLGYQGYSRATERTVDFTTGTRRTFRQTEDSHGGTLALSGNLASRLLWRLSGAASPSEVRRSLPDQSGNGGEDPTSYRFGNEDDNLSLAAHADWVAGDRWLLAAHLGRFDFDTATTNAEIVPFVTIFGGGPSIFPDIPADFQRPEGYSSGPRYNVVRTDRYQRDTAALDASGLLRFAGDHELKVGVQGERLRNDVVRAGNSTRHFWAWDLADPFFGRRGTYGHLQVENPGTFGAVESNNFALFLQDIWRPHPSLVLDLGLRAEREHVPDFRVGREGDAAFTFSFGDKLAPRLGFTWDVRGDGRWALRGNWGTYYDVTKYQMPRGSFGADRRVLYLYAIDDYRWTNVDCVVTDNDPAVPPDCGLPVLGVVNLRSSANDAIDPDIRPTESRQWQVGVTHTLARGASFDLTFTRNELVRVIEDIGAFDPVLGAEIYAIGNPGEGESTYALPGLRLPKARRVYQAVDLTYTRPFADGWHLRAAYTWSRLEGNFPGLASSDEGGRAVPNFTRAWDAWHNLFDASGRPVEGRLPTDRPHQLRLLASWRGPGGLSAGLNQYAGSGTPITTRVSRQGVYFFPYGRGDLGRTPTLTQTDLRLAWTRPLAILSASEIEVSATVLNLFDEDTPLAYGENLLRDDLRLTDAELRAGFDLPHLIATQNPARDPRYRQPSQFQAPREVRVGVLVRW